MSAYIPVELQKQIRNRFVNCCAYCITTEYLTATTFEFEHIIPLSAGGKTEFKNLCLACPSCNRYKATRQTVTDSETQQQQKWNEHFTWNEDATEIIGLTPTGKATIEALKMNRQQLIRVRKMWVKMGEHPPDI